MQVTIDPSLPTPVPVLRSGAQGEAVWQLQERLQALGYLTGSVDGQFGPATKEAVQMFQRQHGLTADGIVGEDTRELLYSDSAQPYATPTPAPTQAAQATEAPAEDDMILLTAEAPIVEALSEELSDVKVCHINIDENIDIAQKYRVMSIPTFIAFKGGEESGRQIGAIPKTALVDLVK